MRPTSRRSVLAALVGTFVGRSRTPMPSVPPRVSVGLERLHADNGGLLRGRTAGLLAHSASVTADGRHALEVLGALGVEVRRLFAPEHGLRGEAAAGERVASGRDPSSGLPVTSLYGERRRPSPADLDGVDALVADLQGAGVRFYTYVSTMLLCLETVAAAGIELWVLDRPNPLGGDLIEGPERDAARPASDVSMAPGPLVHGLTLGEMALYANRQRRQQARVRVVPMVGWTRAMRWIETGRRWIPPSPNLRSAEAALVYPGTCLLEATNVSEGRGTADPFLVLGAPWLEADALADDLRCPGLVLEPTCFTPVSSPSAPRPKYCDTPCQGVRVRIRDHRAVRPYAFGVQLLARLRCQQGFAWIKGGSGLDILLGTARVRGRLEHGDRVADILAADVPAIERFVRDRGRILLY